MKLVGVRVRGTLVGFDPRWCVDRGGLEVLECRHELQEGVWARVWAQEA